MDISKIFRILLLTFLFGTSFSIQAFQESESLEASTQSLYKANAKLQKELRLLHEKVRKKLGKGYPEMEDKSLDSLIKQKLASENESLKAQAKDTVRSYLKNLRQQLAQDLKETPENLPVAQEIQKSINQLQELEDMQALLKDPKQLGRVLELKDLKGLEKRAGSLKSSLGEYKGLFKDWDQKLLDEVTNLPQAKLIKEQLDKMKPYKPLPDGYRDRVEQFQTNDFVKEQLETKSEELKKWGTETLQEKFDAAQSKVSDFKKKFPSLPSIEEAPKRNNPHKGQPFLKRLVLGGDFQVNREKPLSVNAALNLAYPISGKLAMGISGAGRIYNYKPDQNQLKEDQLSIRNFVRYSLGKSFYIQGNYEFTRINSKNVESEISHQWVQNALIGLGRSVQIVPKVNMSVTALYDLFYNAQTSPHNNPLVFRLGFNFGENR